MRNSRLTGRIRYRSHTPIFSNTLLVVQVEYTFGEGPPDVNGLPEYFAGTEWRDAKVEDLPTLGK